MKHAAKLEEEQKGAISGSSGEASGFRPLGEKVAEYTRTVAEGKGKGKRAAPGAGAASSSSSAAANGSSASDAHFEIYKTTWDTPGWREFHRRMQVFALLYIEGASYIHEDEANWEWLTTFQKWQDDEGRTRWAFVGYTSLYRFWHYPSSSRLRLSQFVVLPPYHKQGHGSQLYSEVYRLALEDEAVTELTIEDPNEAFDRLRDTADLKTLLAPGGVIDQAREDGAGIRAPLDRAKSERLRAKAKLAKRQWSRLIEVSLNAEEERQSLRAARKLNCSLQWLLAATDAATDGAGPRRSSGYQSVPTASESQAIPLQQGVFMNDAGLSQRWH